MTVEQYLKNSDGRPEIVSPITSSSGSGDGGKIVATEEATGKLSETVLPAGVGAEIKEAVAGEALSDGAWVNFFDDAGTLKARNADAATAGKEAEGWCDGAVAQDATASIKGTGTINNKMTGLTSGAAYYLSATAGEETTTPPDADGNVQQYLGKALSATELWFQPDGRGTIIH